MSIAVYKLLNRNVTRALKSATHNFVRTLGSTDEPCCGKPTESSKSKEPSPSKADPAPPTPPNSPGPKPPSTSPSSISSKPPSTSPSSISSKPPSTSPSSISSKLPSTSPSSTCPKPPSTSQSATSPKTPPCPPMPQCPPTICPPFVDASNPCNYCPPPCPNPELPDMARLKKWQCFFQEENEIPLYIKRGNFDAFVVQAIYVLTAISFFCAMYSSFNFMNK